jgi:hypothetical protein
VPALPLLLLLLLLLLGRWPPLSVLLPFSRALRSAVTG